MWFTLLACTNEIPGDTAKPTEDTVPETCSEDAACGAGYICEGDECTPGDRNNDIEEAETLLWDEAASAALETSGDVDWFTFVAEGGEFIRARTILDDPEDEDYDTVLTLRDPSGKVVATADDYPTGGSVSSADAVIYAYLAEAGTYSLAVEDFFEWSGEDGVGEPDYSYQVQVEEWTAYTDDPDSVDDPGLSIAPDAANSWNAIGVLIDEAGDTDTIELEFPWNGAELIIAGAMDLGNSAAIPTIELLESDSRLSYGENVGPGGYLIHPSLDEKTYSIVLSDASGEGGSDHWFFIFLNFDEAGSAWEEEAEPNDTNTEGTELVFAETANNDGDPYSYAHLWGDGDGEDDVDWYIIEEPDWDEAHIVLCAASTSHGAGTAPVFNLYEGGGDLIATSADYEDPPDARIESQTMTEDLYLEVIGGDSEADWYKGIVYLASFTVRSYEDGGYSCP